MGIVLSLLLGLPTTTAGNGVITDLAAVAIPAGAYRHKWTAPFGPAGASPLTAQLDIAYKDQTVFYKAKGAAASEFSMETPVTGGATLSTSGPALYLDRIADPSLTATYEALTVRPFTRGNLTLPTNLTGTGTTEDFTWSISNPVEMVRSLGIASRWPDVMEKDNEGPIVVSGTIPKRQLDLDDIDALEASTGFALLGSWVSDTIIASGYPYKLHLSCSNAQYTEGEPDPLMNKRRHGHSFSWKSTTPSTGSTVVEVVNATASYV